MNEMTTIAKPPKGKAKIKSAPAAAGQPAAEIAAPTDTIEQDPLSPDEIADPIDAAIVPSSPEPVALKLLRRAPENVRHTRIDEDVDSLANDIAAHGLLSSLIGYAGTWPEDEGRVFIVGGGRRLQALRQLAEGGYIPWEFAIPVLVRPQEDAVELSLSENLQQRTMSPVDEFFAFQALMERGTNSPAGLAKRFGFSERVVKQRLKMAALDSQILDALRDQRITIDAAMAYASTSDHGIQQRVFKAQARKSHSEHSATGVRWAINNDTKTEAWPLFRFVGAAAYERAGGDYEEGLFDLDSEAAGARRLTDVLTVQRLAGEHIDFQMERYQRDWSAELDLANVTGFVKVDGLTFGRHNMAYHGIDRQVSDGYVWVGNDYNADRVARMLKTIRNNNIPVRFP